MTSVIKRGSREPVESVQVKMTKKKETVTKTVYAAERTEAIEALYVRKSDAEKLGDTILCTLEPAP